MPDLELSYEKIAETVLPLLTTWAVRIVGVVVFLVAAWLVAGWVGRRIRRGMERRRIDPALTGFVGSASRWLIILAAVIAALGIFGVETTSFAAVLGAAGLAVGLAFQGSLSNFAAGVLLLVFRPFKVGDVVTAGGVTGQVDGIGLFTTTLDTFDNRRLVVPNKAVFDGTIENATFHDTRRVDVQVGVEYGAPLDRTREVLEKMVAGIAGRIEEPASAVVLVGLGAHSVDWALRVWCRTADYWDVRERVTREAKLALDAAGIGIPFPQLDVHMAPPAPRR
jgi:small conductance mechanosensitive channel